MVIGSRVLGQREKGALLLQARFGNWLATFLIRLLFGVNFTDLGPFRALRYNALMRLEMQDRNFGWTAEMQVKAARLGLRTAEVPVRYRRRIGTVLPESRSPERSAARCEPDTKFSGPFFAMRGGVLLV